LSDYGLHIKPDGETTLGACPDCGSATRSIWGYVSNAEGARAAYFVRWTEGHLERGAQVVVSIGAWGEQSNPGDRFCFAFECRMGTDRPGFMTIDSTQVAWAQRELLGVKLSRDAALAHSTCREVFSILDRLVEDDQRFRAFLSSGRES
jgi:hypothetical protein